MSVRRATKVIGLLVTAYDKCFCLVKLLNFKQICLTFRDIGSAKLVTSVNAVPCVCPLVVWISGTLLRVL
jgi:hypothetical protein